MTINSFQGEYRFLSNFWPAEVVLDGETYPSVEHAYVAAKTVDLHMRKLAKDCQTAGQVKRFGRTLPLRRDWEEVKLQIMHDLVRQKFAHSYLKEKLLATGDEELVEGNTWNDTFWGVCRGVGENNLGKILMEVRKELNT